jgi:hypothetical protein
MRNCCIYHNPWPTVARSIQLLPTTIPKTVCVVKFFCAASARIAEGAASASTQQVPGLWREQETEGWRNEPSCFDHLDCAAFRDQPQRARYSTNIDGCEPQKSKLNDRGARCQVERDDRTDPQAVACKQRDLCGAVHRQVSWLRGEGWQGG